MLNDTIFLGIVENNVDPINQGRLQVRWFDIHPPYSTGEVPTEALPWAIMLNGSGGKFFGIPDRGEWVVGSFFDGREAQHPFIYGVLNTAKNTFPSDPVSSGTFQSSQLEGLQGGDRPTQAYNYFISKGLTPEQAAAVVGNLQQESGQNLDPTSRNDAGGNLGAEGIAQWRGARQEAFTQRYGVSPSNASFEQQLDFIMFEFNTTESKAYKKLLETNTVEEATHAVDTYYERSGGGTINQRTDNALNVYNSVNSNQNSQISNIKNPYLAPNEDVARNYGNNAIPPQLTGENIQFTPISMQYTNQNPNEPDLPMSGSIRSSVWQTSHDGGFIELNGENNGFINIVHQTGAYISIDQKGNIFIKSAGDSGQFSQGNHFQGIEGTLNIQTGEGINIKVVAGDVKIESEGSINLISHSDVNISAAGKINLSSGEATNINSGKLAFTSTLEDIDIKSSKAVLITSTENTDLLSTSNINIDGVVIYLNRGRAIGAKIAESLQTVNKSAGTKPPIHSSTPAVGGGMIDDGESV